MQYMISQGVKPNLVAAQGSGDAQPVATNNTPQGRGENCRVEVTFAKTGYRYLSLTRPRARAPAGQFIWDVMLFARDMRPMRQYARLAGEATIASSVHIAWDQRAIFWRSLISPNPELPRLLRNLEEDGAMPEESGRSLSVSALIAERAARRRRDREAAGQLERSKEEALTEFKKRTRQPPTDRRDRPVRPRPHQACF